MYSSPGHDPSPIPDPDNWAMARKRAAPFDPPTEQDFAELGPEHVRPGPRGGYMWLCEIEGCKAVATYESRQGKKVCKRHGGSTAAQRDPLAVAKAVAQGKEPPKSPGRPLVHGFYAMVEGHKVAELVEAYRAAGLDVDLTDDDMLYLRAYAEVMKPLAPDALAVHGELKKALPQVQDFISANYSALSELDEVRGLMADMKQTHLLMRDLMDFWKDQEERHERIIQMGKVRAETRLKNAGAAQLDAFTVMLERFMVILSEMLPSTQMEALQARIAKDMDSLPTRAMKG